MFDVFHLSSCSYTASKKSATWNMVSYFPCLEGLIASWILKVSIFYLPLYEMKTADLMKIFRATSRFPMIHLFSFVEIVLQTQSDDRRHALKLVQMLHRPTGHPHSELRIVWTRLVVPLLTFFTIICYFFCCCGGCCIVVVNIFVDVLNSDILF